MAMQAQECCCEISTHAPAGGATVFRSAPLLKRSPFLLTPLREGRRKQDLHRVVRVRISTHAPAGGATKPARMGRNPAINFYSRPCGRGDLPTAHRSRC